MKDPGFFWKRAHDLWTQAYDWHARAARIADAANDRFGPGLDWWPTVYQRLWRHAVGKARAFHAEADLLADQARSAEYDLWARPVVGQ